MSGLEIPLDKRSCVKLEENTVKCEEPLLLTPQNNNHSVSKRPNHGTNSFRRKVALLFHSKAFNLSIVSLCALDGLLVICMLLLEIEALKTKDDVLRSKLTLTQFIFECASLSIVSLFLIEIPIKLWLFGWRFYLKNLLELIDAVVCIVSFAVDVFNIIRHTRHSSHPPKTNAAVTHSTSQTDELEGVQKTLADAAGLLVLFRLWRVIRVVNAIIISVTTTQESTMRNLRESINKAEDRIKELEDLLLVNHILIPSRHPPKNID